MSELVELTAEQQRLRQELASVRSELSALQIAAGVSTSRFGDFQTWHRPAWDALEERLRVIEEWKGRTSTVLLILGALGTASLGVLTTLLLR